MGLYDFVIVDKAGNKVASLQGAHQRSYATYLNKTGEARFVLSPTDPVLTADTLLLGHKELQVWRANKLVWGGELVYARTDLSADDERVEVAAKGYLDLLAKRYVGTAAAPVSYEAGDWNIDQIAAELVYLYAGDFGITIGAYPASSRPADRTNMQYKNLKEIVDEVGNDHVQNGIDFEITPDKKFNVFYPQKGRQLPEIVFEWGVNIVSCYEIRDATELANQVIVLGAGEGSSMVTAMVENTALQAIYKKRQTILYHKEIIGVETLEEHGDKELAVHQLPPQIIGVTTKGDLAPTVGSYEVGDSVRVKIKRGLIDIDGFYRIYGIAVQVTDSDEETIQLIFNRQ
jgi:hypothetical protein